MASRRAFMPRLLECFRAQTYANRELLVVEDDPFAAGLYHGMEVRSVEVPLNEDGSPLLLADPGNPEIRIIRVTSIVLGAKRNAGVEAARGDIIVHFDDDDYSAPNRVAEQIALLLVSGKQVTGYHSFACHETRPTRVLGDDGWTPYKPESWWTYRPQSGLCTGGSSLAYRREWALANPFPAVALGEDIVFAEHAASLGEIVTSDGHEMLLVTNHRGGASGRLIGGAEWTELLGAPKWCGETYV